ncbi:ABC transporter ATP-binding protein [Candidatus Aerophobetes bacterium]|nr:ABC transporter ATP-binding protein [Candidatus Aerophobetes bacterium]
MPILEIVNLFHRYGEKEILRGISLRIEKGEIFALIGPVGAGKTSLLRLINLLDLPTSGKIYFAGEDLLSPPKLRTEKRRKMAMVFQKPVVFNTSVYENIAYPLRIRGYKKKIIREKVAKMLEIVGLQGYEKRNARTLSGGETQRVVLAQAMISSPQLLLLDEPVTNLDLSSILQVENLILKFNREEGTTVILATHDMLQARRLAKRVGVLINGELVQTGSAEEIFFSPANMKVARFVGMENILEGVVLSNKAGIASIKINGKNIEGVSDCKTGEKIYVCIRSDSITLSCSPPSTSARNLLSAKIKRILFSGPLVKVELECPFPLVALITRKSAEELKLQEGMRIYASFKATAIHTIRI